MSAHSFKFEVGDFVRILEIRGIREKSFPQMKMPKITPDMENMIGVICGRQSPSVAVDSQGQESALFSSAYYDVKIWATNMSPKGPCYEMAREMIYEPEMEPINGIDVALWWRNHTRKCKATYQKCRAFA